MVIIVCFFMLLVIMGLASIDSSLKKKVKNDERIINRLDLLLREISNKNQDNNH
jgi:hypothetical protein